MDSETPPPNIEHAAGDSLTTSSLKHTQGLALGGGRERLDSSAWSAAAAHDDDDGDEISPMAAGERVLAVVT